jgi:hypothetical protein
MGATPTQIVAFTAQMILTCSVSLLTHASMENGRYAYNTLTIPLFAELTKLAMAGKGKVAGSSPGGVTDWKHPHGPHRPSSTGLPVSKLNVCFVLWLQQNHNVKRRVGVSNLSHPT